MASATAEVNLWYENLKNRKLEENDKSAATWSKYKNDIQVTKSLLSDLPKLMKHKVMVPIGPRALMPGEIVHTNEFLVNLGDTWFVKRTASQTAEICDRRIKACDEMLGKLEKERDLIVSKSHLPEEQGAFGTADRPDIIEYVTEEENEEWKKQHKAREREYRQKLAEMRSQEKKTIETEEDLWKHLDELELQEELEDELNRLNAENDDDDYGDSNSDSDAGVQDRGVNSTANKSTTEIKTDQNQQIISSREEPSEEINFAQESKTKKRRVSFASDLPSSKDRKTNNNNDCVDDNNDDEPLRLKIKFSNIECAKIDPGNLIIQSPGEIYVKHVQCLNQIHGAVLKNKVNPNIEIELNAIRNEASQDCSSENDNDDDDNQEITLGTSNSIMFKDIKERKPFTISTLDDFLKNKKKMSKFKASRAKSAH